MSQDTKSISRRRFIKDSLAYSALFTGISGLLSTTEASASNDPPPNFVFILCDDLGYADPGCYGSKSIKTPGIDRMASEGMRFTSFYSAAPVCTPSRAALMTGCYPQRVSLPNVLNPDSKVGISSDEVTLAQLLKTRGYATACIGKWHLGYQKPFLPTNHGFDYYFGLPYSNDMDNKGKGVPLYRNEEVIERPVIQETLTERYTQEAIKFIENNKDKPFFLYLPHTFPHVPLHVSERFKGKSEGGLYGDVVECIDWSTGEILDTLAKLGLDKNTVVVFTSDNGPWLTKGKNAGSALPLRDGKATCWEGGMREPCIIRWPGHVPAGKECSEMATMMDFYPTFAALAGASLPKDRVIDGKDIRPFISGAPGAETPYDRFFYYRSYELRAVRSGKWKLVLEQRDKQGKEKTPAALYDLESDISETTDLAPQYPKVVAKLQAMVKRCREDLGDSAMGNNGRNRRPAGKVK